MDQLMAMGAIILAALIGIVPSAFFGRLTGDAFYLCSPTIHSDAPATMTWFAGCAGIIGALIGPIFIARLPTPGEAFIYSFCGSLVFALALCIVVLVSYWLARLIGPPIRAGMKMLFGWVDKI
ncbi:MAG: hypothetical protein HY711_02830 [Candidatus Melainabacteria bacterium]|nr:hypothetical protein [Candidatus Melainabacteria bacterium]